MAGWGVHRKNPSFFCWFAILGKKGEKTFFFFSPFFIIILMCKGRKVKERERERGKGEGKEGITQSSFEKTRKEILSLGRVKSASEISSNWDVG